MDLIEKFDNLSLNISASQKGAVSTLTKCLDNDESMIIFKREEKEYFILKDNLYEKTNDGWKPSQNSLTEVYTYLKLFSNSASKEKCKTTTYADQEKIYNSIMSYVTEESINSRIRSGDLDDGHEEVFIDFEAECFEDFCKNLFSQLNGPASYELYVNYAKFALCVLKYSKEGKNIHAEILEGQSLVTKKIIASLRIACLIENFGLPTLKFITRVPISYWEKLSYEKWKLVENSLKDGLNFSKNWVDTANSMSKYIFQKDLNKKVEHKSFYNHISYQKEKLNTIEKVKCFFCHEIIKVPFSKRIIKFMEHLKLPPEDINSLSIGNAFEIHRIHNAEDIIVPKGISKGYPLNINFDIVYQRVKKLIPEWKKLLTKTRPSSFLDTALKERHEIGKLINPNIAYYRYKINAGYYGTMGSTIITKCISNNLIIDPAQTLPLTCSEFIQYVLIPETAIMLILEDREGITYEQAKKINEESTEFGNFVHDVELNDLE